MGKRKFSAAPAVGLSDRDMSITLLYNAGIPASRIGAVAGLTAHRIRQIAGSCNARMGWLLEEARYDSTYSRGTPVPD